MASSKVLEIIVKAKDQASKEFDEISKTSKKLSDSLKNVKKYSGIATTALVWLWAVMVKQAMDIEPVKNAFDWLTKSVGASGDEMLKSLKDASKWAVSSYDLMLSANTAMKLWVANNTDDMTNLMKIARLYWQQMWQDVSSSFNDIVRWLWRWSAQILDNLWIVVDSAKAYEDYAKQLWKTTKELTKEEQVQALVNATIEEWKKALDEFGEPLPTMTERVQALKISFIEMWTKIWQALLPVLEKILNVVQPIIDKVANWIEQNPELASKILLVATAVAWLTFWLTLIIPKIVSLIPLLSWPAWLVVACGALFGALSLLENKIISTDEQLAIYNQEVATLNELYNAWLISQEEYRAKMEELELQIQATKDKANTFWQYLKDGLNDVLRNMTHIVQSSKEAFKSFGIIVQAVGWFFDRLAESIWTFFVNAVQKAKEKIDWLISSLKTAFQRAQKVGADIGWSVSNAFNSVKSWITWKASWWPVSANTPYVVGENWPELFVPNSSWNIVPNENLWWIVVNVNFGGVAINNGSDEMSFAQTITDQITRELELYKKGIY